MGPRGDFYGRWPRYTVSEASSKHFVFALSGLVCAHYFGAWGRFPVSVTPGSRFERHRQNPLFLRFLVAFVGYSTLFWGPGTISRVCGPGKRFGRRSQHSSFLHFLVVFVGNSTLFWGPRQFPVSVARHRQFESVIKTLGFRIF